MTQQKNIQEVSLPSQDSFALRLSKYSLLAQVYFFFNSILLPKGLLFTTILSPVFFYNTIKQKRQTFVLHFFVFLFIYDMVHLYLGVDKKSFLISNGLFIATYFTVISIYYFFYHYKHLGRIYKELLITNSLLVVVSVPFFFMPRQYQEWFWYFNEFSKGLKEFPRLAMFTYEASYYSLLLVPLTFYYFLKLALGEIKTNKLAVFLMCFVPLLFSLSFGVIGCSLITIFILCVVFNRRLLKFKRFFLLLTGMLISVIIATFILIYVFPNNPLSLRIKNIVEGSDTSARGRTVESFGMAWKIADEKSILFGAGLGQIKMRTAEMVARHYKYWGKFDRYDIPNAMGETLAIFGLLGVVFRLALQLWLFFKTKVSSNYYRLALFIFVFIYQFTGSFITNIVEYVIWGLAFSNVFSNFNIRSLTQLSKVRSD